MLIGPQRNRDESELNQGTKKPAAGAGSVVGSGEGGIRTLDRVAPIQHFQCCAFDHSATSPAAVIGQMAM